MVDGALKPAADAAGAKADGAPSPPPAPAAPAPAEEPEPGFCRKYFVNLPLEYVDWMKKKTTSSVESRVLKSWSSVAIAPKKKPVCLNCNTMKKEEEGGGAEADIYCVDCDKTFCLFCATLLHHPTTNGERHSLEQIDKKKGDVRLVTPILLDIMVVLVMVLAFRISFITRDYFEGTSHCPGISFVRRLLMRYDANLFFYTKASLAKFCDCEDSYWRFFMDTWIQSILTGADSWLLLLSEVVRAGAMEELFRAALSKPVAYVYTAAAFVVRSVELEIEAFVVQTEDQPELPNVWAVKGIAGLKAGANAERFGDPKDGDPFTEAHLAAMGKTEEELLEDGTIKVAPTMLNFLKKVTQWIEQCAIFSSFLRAEKVMPPPPTMRRKRPMKDWSENFAYHKSRWTRRFKYDRLQAESAFQKLARQTLFWATVLRVLCLIGLAPYIRAACLSIADFLGYESAKTQHLAWITEFYGVQVDAADATRLSDWLAMTFVLPNAIYLCPLLALPLVPVVVPVAVMVHGLDVEELIDDPMSGARWVGLWFLYSFGFRVVSTGFVKWKTTLAFALVLLPLFKLYDGNVLFYITLLPLLMYFGAKKWKKDFLAKQQKKFASNWLDENGVGDRQVVWGTMSREEPLKGYQQLSFVDPTEAKKAKDRWCFLALFFTKSTK